MRVVLVLLIGSMLFGAPCLTAPARAELLVYEGFNYDVGTLNGKDGGFGFSGAWTGGPWKVAASSLSYPAGSTLPRTGNRAMEDDGVAEASTQRSLSTTIDLGAEGVYYFSMLMNKSDGGASADALNVYFHGGGAQKARVGIGSNEAILFGLANGWTSGAGTLMPKNTDILLVGKFITSASQNDELHLVRYLPNDEVPLTEPINWPESTTANMSGVIASISLAMGVGTGQIDEIRIGTTWASVAIPEPSALVLLAGGMCAFLACTPRKRRR